MKEFRDISRRYSHLQPIVQFLENVGDLEDRLEAYRAEAETDIERRRQLTAMKYYLRDVIQLCQNDWLQRTSGLSNYQAFLDQVRRTAERVCFVTFNYDTLMEGALAGMDVPLRQMNDYVSHHKYSLLKLHGSIDWVQWVPQDTLDTQQSAALHGLTQDSNSKVLVAALIRAAPVTDTNCAVDTQHSTGQEQRWRSAWPLPALAIPTVSKHTFVCPRRHLDHLQGIIPQVTRIAVIGWRGAESHSLKLLEEGLERRVSLLAACGGDKESSEPYERLTKAGVPIDSAQSRLLPMGFSELVSTNAIEPFLSAS